MDVIYTTAKQHMPGIDRALHLEPQQDEPAQGDGIDWQPLVDPRQLVDLIEE